MATERLKLKAEMREVGTKGILGSLRRAGRIPSVLYGHGFETMNLSVNGRELSALVQSAGLNVLMELDFEGKKTKDPLVVMIKDFQTDVIHHHMIHIDLMKVDMKEKVTVAVPVKLIGKAIGLEKGGLIEQPRRDLDVRCLPTDIPEVIEVDVSGIDIGHSLHVSALKLPEGVEIVQDPTFTVVAVVAPKEEKAPEPVAVEGAAVPGVEGAVAAAPAEGAEKVEEKKEEKKEGKK